MYYRTDDPAADFARHDAAQEAARERLPRCTECHRYIDDDFAYRIGGEVLCEECVENCKVFVSDLME